MDIDYTPAYCESQEVKISSEFQRLKDYCYLEHAGATLYSERQIADILQDLSGKIYANPHAKSTTSKVTEDCIDQIRFQILNHFNTNIEEYSVVFTNGATGALKLVAECFRYNGGCFVHLQDNHTSVLGIRAYAPNTQVLSHNDAFNLFNNNFNNRPLLNDNFENVNSLFAYPAQCNFSGTKYPLRWIEKVQNGILDAMHSSNRWFCMLDAAAFASTNFLDLSNYKPDFVCVSFYKLFGYPTGLGALLIKKGAEDVLLKKYYGGGTVLMALSIENTAIPRNTIHEKFEDGTISFLDIISLKHCFATLKRLDLNMHLISKQTFLLAKYVYNHLLRLHHSNGNPVAVLYHDTTFEDREHQGGIINFNLLRSNGEYIGYAEVLHVANLFGIQLRTGCFCNPGACQRHLKLSTDDVKRHFEKGHICGDQNDLIDGVPTGSVRISFGYMSTKRDADDFLKMIRDSFIEKPLVLKLRNFKKIRERYCRKFCLKSDDKSKEIKSELSKNNSFINTLVEEDTLEETVTIQGVLSNIYIYPIKSCGSFKIDSEWDLVSTGLKYDREWMIVNDSGVCLTQKTHPDLCKIKPFVNLDSQRLHLQCEDHRIMAIPLQLDDKTIRSYYCRSKVCGDPIVGWDCGDEVGDWLDEILKAKGLRLLKHSSEKTKTRRKQTKSGLIELSLSNQAQFLLVNRKSIEWLRQFLLGDDSFDSVEGIVARFRPNFVVDFDKPFVENDLVEFTVRGLKFTVSGKCTRCQVICIDQNTGQKSIDLLRVLSKEFHGKISFGMYLKQGEGNERNPICVNSEVIAVANVI